MSDLEQWLASCFGVDVEGMFPEIPDGVVVRTLLKYEDLVLLRGVFVEYAKMNVGSDDVVRLGELMRRMLRKGGSKFYLKGK